MDVRRRVFKLGGRYNGLYGMVSWQGACLAPGASITIHRQPYLRPQKGQRVQSGM